MFRKIRRLIKKFIFWIHGINLDEYEQFVIQFRALEQLNHENISFNEYIQKYFNNIMKSSCSELHNRIKEEQYANIKK